VVQLKASAALKLTNRFFAHLENALYATLYNRTSPSSPIEHYLSVRLLYSAFNNYKSGTCGYGRAASTKVRHVKKLKKNAMSLANTYRDMNNSPRRKTMGDSEKLEGFTEETLKSIGISHEI